MIRLPIQSFNFSQLGSARLGLSNEEKIRHSNELEDKSSFSLSIVFLFFSIYFSIYLFSISFSNSVHTLVVLISLFSLPYTFLSLIISICFINLFFLFISLFSLSPFTLPCSPFLSFLFQLILILSFGPSCLRISVKIFLLLFIRLNHFLTDKKA
jgi:hypothetical protein